MFIYDFYCQDKQKITFIAPMNPSSQSKRLPGAARLQAIREELGRSASLSVSDISGKLGVSEMTIRRDLTTLEKSSDVRRTHGGAVVAERMAFEFNYLTRQRARLKEKQAIAEAARKLIEPGQRLILDTGTTTLQLATLLKDCAGLTVITPSLAVASELQFSENISVVLLGGILHRGSPDLTGPVTEHCLELFSADWVFQGAEALGDDGNIFNVDLQLAQVDRIMRKKAARSCLLADSSKVGQTALVKTGTLADFDVFITDCETPREYLRMARKMAGKVILV
jgi:DeoR/GlpR family transcriptional regulator of sugar metabolism